MLDSIFRYVSVNLTLDDQIRSENTHSTDTDTRLGSTICSTETGEDNGGSATHGTEEWLHRG